MINIHYMSCMYDIYSGSAQLAPLQRNVHCHESMCPSWYDLKYYQDTKLPTMNQQYSDSGDYADPCLLRSSNRWQRASWNSR